MAWARRSWVLHPGGITAFAWNAPGGRAVVWATACLRAREGLDWRAEPPCAASAAEGLTIRSFAHPIHPLVLGIALAALGCNERVSWIGFHGDAVRSGWNPRETALTCEPRFLPDSASHSSVDI